MLSEDFIQATRSFMGEKLFRQLMQGLGDKPTVSIRLNPLKAGGWTVSGADGEVPWCREGYYLKERPEFTFDPLLHAGLYYVQEASSMFVSHVLRSLVSEPSLVLDLCAAPGGKSGVALGALPEGSVLLSNEPVRTRANVLSENIRKTGAVDVLVSNNYPKDFQRLNFQFDVVLADVPCSGEGMFRKDECAIAEWSAAHVDACQALQRSIVDDIWPCLREGGLLVYSTCTFNRKEDEDNVDWIVEHLGAERVAVKVEPDWLITGNLTGDGPVYRFLPGLSRGEGLFLAVLRKPGCAAPVLPALTREKGKKNRSRQPNAVPKECKLWMSDADHYTFGQHGDRIVAVPNRWQAVYEEAARKLSLLQAGVTVASLKGHAVIPDESLALSAGLRADAFPRFDLTYGDAMAYLSRQPIVLSPSAPRGFVLVSFEQVPLGFVNNLGTRANNLFPNEWKVRSQKWPASSPCILRRQ